MSDPRSPGQYLDAAELADSLAARGVVGVAVSYVDNSYGRVGRQMIIVHAGYG